MNPIMILAQVLGFVGAAIEISSFQWKDSKKLFLIQIIFSTIFSVHYLLLAVENPSAYTGVLLNLAGMIRAVFLFFGDRQWARSRIALVGVMLLMAVCGIVTWEGWISLLPTAAMVVGTPFLWTRNGKTLRLAQLFVISPCWLIYNAAVFSVAGVLTECFNVGSVIVSICRFGLKGLDRSMELQTEKKTEQK
ncbi:MAG: YgjV family protein [Firmicutes bacterium]|nr:YgjV family protein [Bacillota bacterium]